MTRVIGRSITGSLPPITRISLAAALTASICLGGCGIPLPNGLPPDDEPITTIAADYLDDHLIDPAFGGQIFCETEMLHAEQQKSAIKAYVWALCIEYYEEGQTMKMGTAVSEPLLVYMIEHEGRILASGYAEPRDGTLFAEDIQQMFPSEAVEHMCLGDIPCRNDRLRRLEAGVEEQLRQVTNLPIATAPAD